MGLVKGSYHKVEANSQMRGVAQTPKQGKSNTQLAETTAREARDYWPCRFGQHEILPVNTYHNVLKTRIMINQTKVILTIFISLSLCLHNYFTCIS